MLSLPEQHPAEPGSFDTRPKSVNAWIEALPMANLGETSRLVFKVLVELNRVELPARQRMQTLELLLKPAEYVATSLEKQYAGRPLPLHDRHRKISELSRALLSELATGYKIVARSLLSARGRLDQKMVAFALHRAMYYLGELLLRSYQVYTPYPKHVWLELHSMYQYAEHYKLLTFKYPLPLGTDKECSLSQIYKRCVLLSLAMPYQLLRGEIDIVASSLCHLVGLLRIEKIPDYTRPNTMFIVDLMSDQHPTYTSLYNSNDFNHCRAINMSELLPAMSTLDEHIPADMIQRLRDAWSIMPKRGFSRSTSSCTPVEVALGLSAAHYFVGGEVDFTPDLAGAQEESEFSMDATSAFTSTFIHNESDVSAGPDIWSRNYSYSENDPRNAPSDTTVLNRGIGTQPATYQKHVLDMLNSSAGGYCLTAANDLNIAAHVGELLAIREQHNIDIDQWGIGVIRRMQSIGNSHIEFGIQMLTPNAIAVAARVTGSDGKRPSTEYLRCLMLPELRAINQPATLITPVLPFKQGSQIHLNISGRAYEAELMHVREKTRSFIQFEFTMKEITAPRHHEPATNDDKDEPDFDTLWSIL
jgi:hypothetical protein